MPRETIRRLSDDTERLLVAGAHLAQGSADLARDKEALGNLIAKLGAKAPPVFAKLVEQIDKTTKAKPSEQAAELLTLMTSVAQVSAGLAQLAPAEGNEPIAPAPEVQTPCNAKDLYALHDALVVSGQGRMEKINDAVERGDVADLRLVHAVVQAMGDTYVGEKVSDDVAPKFGRAIVDPVRAKLRFPGKTADGRRLRALVAVEKAGARELVEQAIREGSPEVREAALDALADHMTGVPEFEAIALGILVDGSAGPKTKERSGGVRRAAVRALGGYSSDKSLELLLEAIQDERTAWAASEALGKSTHPKVVDRLLELLTKAAADAKAPVKKTDKAGVKKQEDAKKLGQLVLGALAEHDDPRVPRAARELVDLFGESAAEAVVRHGKPDEQRAVADLLAGDDAELFRVAVKAVKNLPADESFERLLKVLRAKDRDGKLGKARVSAIEYEEVAPSGDKWVEALVKLVKDADSPECCIDLLGATKDARAYAPLLAIVEKGKGNAVYRAMTALGELGDKRAIDPLLARLKTGSYGWRVQSAVVELADESTVDKVRDIYAALKEPDSYKNWHIRSLLRRLEQKFPGH